MKICATGAVALALVGGLAWWVAPRLAAGPLDLAQAVEKDHREFLQGKVSPEFTGALPDEIASKLEGRLDAAAFNKVPAAGHFRSEGARLCHLEGVPVAWTLGRCNDVPVSLVVFNKSELNHFPEVRHRLNTGEPIVCTRTGRFQFAVRFSGDHVVCAIADTSRQMLEELLKAVPGPG